MNKIYTFQWAFKTNPSLSRSTHGNLGDICLLWTDFVTGSDMRERLEYAVVYDNWGIVIRKYKKPHSNIDNYFAPIKLKEFSRRIQ